MEMKVAICEDNGAFREYLGKETASFFAEKEMSIEVCYFESGEQFVAHFRERGEYGAIFMDVDLGEKNDGIEVVAQVRRTDREVPVIFVTSFEGRAIDGYDVDAFAFVAKRTVEEKLPMILEKLWREYFRRRVLVVTQKSSTSVVQVASLLWIESEGRATKLHTRKDVLLDTRGIGEFSKLLSEEDFVEVHKSIYVSIAKIKRIETDRVVLCDETAVPLSRRNRKNVMQAVMKKVGSR